MNSLMKGNLISRFFWFILVNLAFSIIISAIASIIIHVFKIDFSTSQINADDIPYKFYLFYSVLFGFTGALLSLATSRMLAKRFMQVEVVDKNPEYRNLVNNVHAFARRAGLEVMPEVGVYPSQEVNAFATGPTRNRSLVAVSQGLLDRMSREEIDGVLAHEVAHIANGDMVTMTLIQGLMNTFVLFLSYILTHIILRNSQSDNQRGEGGGGLFARIFIRMGLQIILGLLAGLIVSKFSRWREFRADQGGAEIGGRNQMIAALKALKRIQQEQLQNNRRDFIANQSSATHSMQGQDSIQYFKISGKTSRSLAALFSTHPPLEDRIQNLLTKNHF